MIVPHPPPVQIAAWLLLPLACAQASPQTAPAPPVADLAIRNAKILTIDEDRPYAQAIAFRGEIILAVGTDEEIGRYVKEGATKMIDARGRLVVPGFNDAHIHFDLVDPDYIELRYTTDAAVITRKVKEAKHVNVARDQLIVLIAGRSREPGDRGEDALCGAPQSFAERPRQ